MEDMVFGRRYRVTEKIGAGGMAEVFKAVDEVLGRTVAVKVLHPRYAADPTFAARFRQEAQAAANIQSPYIVNIYDWGQDESTYYIVMELVRGTDLKSLITQRGPIPSKRAAEIGAQVCAALSAAHGYDVIHRDIKPHNIMLTADGAVKVMDFGIARAGNTTMTQTGSVLGTAHYVSPEQAQGRTLTAASDLYSLGVVLYEMATGQLPFDGDTPVAVALKQVNEMPVPPRSINPDIDPDLENVILHAMAKSTDDRYETADEMRRDLLRVARGEHVAPIAVPIGAPRSAAVAPASETSVLPAVDAYPDSAVARRAPLRKKPVWPWVLGAIAMIAVALGIAWYAGLLGPGNIAVPKVVGMTQADAEAAIDEAGFVVGKILPQFSEAEKGTVTGQSPQAGGKAPEGSAIDITVSKGPDLTNVPTLIGLSEAEAEAALEAAGLSGEGAEPVYSTEFPFGQVVSQEPAPDTKVERGSTVQYVTSRGVEVSNVPRVTGLSQKDAEKMLKDAGFKVSVKNAFSSDTPKGEVISQNPSQDIRAEQGSTVTITVSDGPEKVRVPDVIGQQQADAEAMLSKAGLKVDTVFEMHTGTQVVIDQSPKANSEVERGTTVVITVDSDGGQPAPGGNGD